MVIKAKFSGKCSVCGKNIAVGADIEWSKGSGARHVKCPVAKAVTYEFPTWKVYGGSGYGNHGWTTGDIIQNKGAVQGAPEWLCVLTAKSQYVRDDGLSFGVGEDRGYRYEATCREATEAEFAPVVAERKAKLEEAQRIHRLQAIGEEVLKIGDRCDAVTMPNGDQIVWQVIKHSLPAYMVIDGDEIHSYHPGWYDDWQHRHAILKNAELVEEIMCLVKKNLTNKMH